MGGANGLELKIDLWKNCSVGRPMTVSHDIKPHLVLLAKQQGKWHHSSDFDLYRHCGTLSRNSWDETVVSSPIRGGSRRNPRQWGSILPITNDCQNTNCTTKTSNSFCSTITEWIVQFNSCCGCLAKLTTASNVLLKWERIFFTFNQNQTIKSNYCAIIVNLIFNFSIVIP